MTSYGLTITDKACESADNCTTQPWQVCAGCNERGDGTRTVPVDRDATPLAEAVKAFRAAPSGREAELAVDRVFLAALALFPKEDTDG